MSITLQRKFDKNLFFQILIKRRKLYQTQLCNRDRNPNHRCSRLGKNEVQHIKLTVVVAKGRAYPEYTGTISVVPYPLFITSPTAWPADKEHIAAWGFKQTPPTRRDSIMI